MIFPSSTAIKAKTIWLEIILATHYPDLVGPSEECLGARAGRACYDVPGSESLGPSSVVPLQERRVSESKSVRAMIRRVCRRDHWWLLRPHPVFGLGPLLAGFWFFLLGICSSPFCFSLL